MNWIRQTYLDARGALLRQFYPPSAETVDLGSIHKILVLRYDRIGDMVQTTPLFAALRDEFPDANISVLASESNAPVLLGNPHVDRTFVLAARGRDAVISELNRIGFDLVIDAYLSYDWAWTRVAANIKARYRLGLDLYGRGRWHNIRVAAPLPKLSAGESILEICRRGLNRPFHRQEPKIYLQEGETDSAWKTLQGAGLALSRPVVLLHPGGHYPEQRWPAEHFARVAVALDESGDYAAALVGGPADEALLGRAAGLEPSVKVLRTNTLRQVIAAISCARLVICNNSGPLHLACALSVPTLSTLGPTDLALWAPHGPEHQILERHPLDALRVDEVLKAAREFLRQPAAAKP